jgi:hypothetical protein
MSDKVEYQLELLKDQLNSIEDKLNRLIQTIQDKDAIIVENCVKMGAHINFVNDVYESIKTPMFYISDKINTMMDTSNKSIQNKKDPN